MPTENPKHSRGPRGRPSWVVGTKFIFLNQYSADWQQATDQGVVATGHFYTKVTKHFIKKYGWHFDRWQDWECADLDEATMDDDEVGEDVDNAECEWQSAYYNQLRDVSGFHLWTRVRITLTSALPQVIMAWYHTFNKKVSSGNVDEIEKVFHEMTETLPKMPKIMRTAQFYSKKYYKTCIKLAIDVEWDLIKNTLPKPSRIMLTNKITNQLYASESQSFKDQLEIERQQEHARDLEEYKNSLSNFQRTPDSAETFHQ